MMPATVGVQILDISTAGVLLQSNEPVDMGVQGCLSLNLGGFPFKADVQVQRVVSADPAAGYRLGARFIALSSGHRQLIERFMTQ